MTIANTLSSGSIVNINISQTKVKTVVNYPGLSVCGFKIISTRSFNTSTILEDNDLEKINNGLIVTDMGKNVRGRKVGHFQSAIAFDFDFSSGTYLTEIKIETKNKKQTLKNFFESELGINKKELVVLSTIPCH